MTLPEQANVLSAALRHGFIDRRDILRWAVGVVKDVKPLPDWIIEINEFGSGSVVDVESVVHEHGSKTLSARRQVQIVLLSSAKAGVLSNETLDRLFSIVVIPENKSHQLDALDENLVEAIVYWECMEHPVVNEELRKMLIPIFKEYLKDADEVAAIAPWKFAIPIELMK